MLPSDYEYVEGMKIKLDQLNAEITGSEAAVAFIYERGESSPGEIGKHLADLDLLRTQAWFAGVAVSLLEESKLPERELTVPARKSGDITDLMIDRARAYPIEKLVDVRRGKALCPFHDDHHPSMSVKNNLFHCFTCDASGDSIQFVTKMQDTNFIQAVKYLNGNI